MQPEQVAQNCPRETINSERAERKMAASELTANFPLPRPNIIKAHLDYSRNKDAPAAVATEISHIFLRQIKIIATFDRKASNACAQKENYHHKVLILTSQLMYSKPLGGFLTKDEAERV